MENDIFSLDENYNLIVTTWVDYFDIFDIEYDEDEQDAIYDYIDSLPSNITFDRVRTDKGIFTDWDDYAKKGIIAYDNFYGNSPILTSNPHTNITIEDIPDNIVRILEKYSNIIT